MSSGPDPSSYDPLLRDTSWIDRVLEDAQQQRADTSENTGLAERPLETTRPLPVVRPPAEPISAETLIEVRWSDNTITPDRPSSLEPGLTVAAEPPAVTNQPAPLDRPEPHAPKALQDLGWLDQPDVAPAGATIVVPTTATVAPPMPASPGPAASIQEPLPGTVRVQDPSLGDRPRSSRRDGATERLDAGSDWARAAREWGMVLIFAVVVAFLVRMFLIQAYHIPSGSMEETLEIGDRVIVNRLSYSAGDAQRGEIVVFDRPPGQEGTADHLIKRVIGLPGETVLLRDGQVYVDGFLVEEPYLRPNTVSRPRPRGGVGIPGCDNVTLSPDTCVVPEGTLFVMGDNRGASEDSRTFGPIQTDSVEGRAFLRVWPLRTISWL